MKKNEVPFEYTTFFIFELLLKVNYKPEMSIDKLFEVRKILLDDFSLLYYNEILNRKKTINRFLNDYSAYVYTKDDKMYLKDDVDEKDLNILLKDISHKVILNYSTELFKYLGILEPINFIDNLNTLEEKIEQLYNKDELKKIKEYLSIRFDMYNSFSIQNEDIIEIISDLQSENRALKEEDYILYPINKTNYENSKFSDTEYRIDDMLKTPIQKAIFSDIPLYRSKVRFDIDTTIDDMEYIAELEKNEYDNVEYDDNVDYDDYNEHLYNFDEEYSDAENKLLYDIFNSSYENLSRKDIIFALKYIDEINEFEKNYGKNKKLDTISKRLKYIIDSKEMDITSKNNDQIKVVLNNYLENDFQVFDEFEEESAYLLYEIISDHSDSLFLQKVLFVKTYYDLTYDNELFNIFANKYQNNRKYKIVHNFIMSDNPNAIIDDNKNEYNKAKMLVINRG